MRLLRYCFPSFFAFFAWWRERLTAEGAALMVATVVSALYVLQSETSMIHFFAGCAALLSVSAFVGWCWRPLLRVTAKCPTLVPCGEWFTVALRVQNLRQTWVECVHWMWQAERLVWDFQPRAGEVDATDQQAVVPLEVRLSGLQRGVYSLPALLTYSIYPLHLFRWRQLHTLPGEICIAPAPAPFSLLSAAELAAGSQGEWEVFDSLTRGSQEYIGNREFQPGLAVRRFDYASWARLGKPIVREYLDTAPARARLFVDTYISLPPDSSKHPSFEAMLSVAARLVEDLSQFAWLLETFICGEAEFNAPHAGFAVTTEAALTVLARTEAEPPENWSRFADSCAQCMQRDGLNLLVFTAWNEERLQLCEHCTQQQIPWRGWLVSDLAPSQPLPEGLHWLSTASWNHAEQTR